MVFLTLNKKIEEFITMSEVSVYKGNALVVAGPLEKDKDNIKNLGCAGLFSAAVGSCVTALGSAALISNGMINNIHVYGQGDAKLNTSLGVITVFSAVAADGFGKASYVSKQAVRNAVIIGAAIGGVTTYSALSLTDVPALPEHSIIQYSEVPEVAKPVLVLN